MKTDTHTQGEWEASGCTIYSGETILAVAYCEGNRSLHNLHEKEMPPGSDGEGHGKGWEEAWANARLIAAAPEMIAALQSLTHPMASDEDLQNALAVIDKVKGGGK